MGYLYFDMYKISRQKYLLRQYNKFVWVTHKVTHIRCYLPTNAVKRATDI